MISGNKSIDSDFYDNSGYHEINASHLRDFKSRFQKYRVQKIRDIYDPQSTDVVVDFGCGWGTFCWAFARRVKSVVGVDFSEKSILLCNEQLNKWQYDNVTFLHGDARRTNLPSEMCDLIIAADLFEHLYPEDSRQVIEEAFRLLKKQGHFSIWTPHRGHIIEILKNRNILFKKDQTHVDYKSMQVLIEMLERAGFRVKKHYYAESHIPGFNTIEGIFSKLVPCLRRRIAILAYKP